MIRKTNTFKYQGKMFKVGDVTVGTYMKWILNPDETLREILLEFNEKIPELDEEQLKNFLEVIFHTHEDKKPRRSNEKISMEEEYYEMEYFVLLLAKNLGQPLSDILALPIESYIRISGRLPEILDPSKYKRLTKGIDKKAMRTIKNIINNTPGN